MMINFKYAKYVWFKQITLVLHEWEYEINTHVGILNRHPFVCTYSQRQTAQT